MSRRALITTATDIPAHVKTWTTVDLGKDDLIIIVGEENSPHQAITDFIHEIVSYGGPSLTYITPEIQARWQVFAQTPHSDITQRVSIGILEALDAGAEIITVVGEGVRPLTTDFYARTEGALRGAAPHFLVSSESGWWNVGTLSDPPTVVRGFPLSERHYTPQLRRLEEMEHPLRPAVLVHQVTGDPDVDAIDYLASRTQVNRFRSDTNVLLAPGTWCPFSFRGAVSFSYEMAPLMFVWPYVGRYGDIWASFLAQRVMHELGRHVVLGFPLVGRHGIGYDAMSALSDELAGMRRTEHVVETLRNVTYSTADDQPFRSAREALPIMHDAILSSGSMLLGREMREAFADWRNDIDKIPGL